MPTARPSSCPGEGMGDRWVIGACRRASGPTWRSAGGTTTWATSSVRAISASGLSSHDPGVAVIPPRLFHAGLFPPLIFTGANAPTTIERFPRGKAVHYREYAIENGVPDDATLVEGSATNTAENLDRSRRLLA